MKSPTSRSNTPIYVYVGGIVVLFVAMAFYTRRLDAAKREQGLGEATIGQIDTGSFMLKLALLGGARGVAANVLWIRAEELKRAHEWDRLKATIDLITKLQPHFLSVWTFQGWNLAYNVSVEWDAPEDKYDWIKQGIKFLKEGVAKNGKSPDLVWDTAWTYYHKLGFSDESIVLRKLFREDEEEPFKTYTDLRTGTPKPCDDNFQLGYGWFSNAIKQVDDGAVRIAATGFEAGSEFVDKPEQHKGKPGDLAFRSMPAHAQTRYAERLEKESILGYPATFGEKAPLEWGKALNEWVIFGRHEWPAFNDDKVMVRLDDDTLPAVREKLPANAKYWTERWSNQMNYPYWKDRSDAESEREAVRARQLFYEGTKAYKAGRFIGEKAKDGVARDGAVESFRKGLALWDTLLKKHIPFRDDDLNLKDTGLIVRRYLSALKQVGQPVPDDIPFQDKLKQIQADPTFDPFDVLEMIKPGAKERRPAGLR